MGPRKSVPPRATVDADTEWTHDLHSSIIDDAPTNAPSGPRGSYPSKRPSRLAHVVDNGDSRQYNVVGAPSKPRGDLFSGRAATKPGITIKGLAGPYAVMAQNFAPGTTAADIESAMTPVGGEMHKCVVVKTSPLMLVEMVFASREGGERVIETFNNQPVSCNPFIPRSIGHANML